MQLDAVVSDKAGRPVGDLTPADFEVVEGGRKRTVTHVTYVQPSEHRGDALGRRTVVFLVDDLHLSQRGIAETRDLLSSFARTHLAPSDLVTIAKASDVGEKGLQFASGAAAIQAAAEGIRYSRVSLAQDALVRRVFLDGSNDGLNRRTYAETVLPWVSPESDALDASRMAARSVVALKAVVGALRGLPGRKAVVFVSQGFVSELPSLADQAGRFRRETFGSLDGIYGDVTLRAAVRGVNDLANRASVVVYGLDPTGPAHAASASDLGLPSMGGVGEAPGLATFTSAAISGARQREVRQNGLLDLAVPTGGLVVARHVRPRPRPRAHPGRPVRLLPGRVRARRRHLRPHRRRRPVPRRRGEGAPAGAPRPLAQGLLRRHGRDGRGGGAGACERRDRYARCLSNSARTVPIVSASPAGLSVR